MTDGSTIFTGRSRPDGRGEFSAAVRIGKVEVSDRPHPGLPGDNPLSKKHAAGWIPDRAAKG